VEGAVEKGRDTFKLDMTARFLGLVVVPGKYITKMEVEERVGR
jgi:N-alpha-acetyltransferase 38, NatC auxiliary subunit